MPSLRKAKMLQWVESSRQRRPLGIWTKRWLSRICQRRVEIELISNNLQSSNSQPSRWTKQEKYLNFNFLRKNLPSYLFCCRLYPLLRSRFHFDFYFHSVGKWTAFSNQIPITEAISSHPALMNFNYKFLSNAHNFYVIVANIKTDRRKNDRHI